MITIDGIQYFKKEELQSDINAPKGDRAHTFLELGKPYMFRTVTMIYTGILVAVSEQEYFVKEAAWIPDTERWMDAVTKAAFKEVEPYGDKPIIINRGAMLDAVEIPNTVRKQK
jgi:hypothetical protein